MICVFDFLHPLRTVVRWYPWTDVTGTSRCLQVPGGPGGCPEEVYVLVPCPEVPEIRGRHDHLVGSGWVFPSSWKFWLRKLITETWDLLASPRKHCLPDLDHLSPGQSRWDKLAWESRSCDVHGSQGTLRGRRCVYAQSTADLPVEVTLPVPGLRGFSGAASIGQRR